MSIGNVLAAALPWWARVLALSLALGIVFLFGQIHGERIAGQNHLDYVSQQAAQTVKIIRAQQAVVVKTEIKYRDRIQKIYLQGEQIEKQVPIYVTPADDAACVVGTGFVRMQNAAWSGQPAGPATESDREPSGLSLAAVAETDAHNATSCRAWRDQALVWREFYQELREAIPACN